MNDLSAHYLAELWRASWQGGVFVAAVWALCRLPLGISARTRFWAWWIASIQMVARLAFAVPIAVKSAPPEAATVVTSTGSDPIVTVSHVVANSPTLTTESLAMAAWLVAVGVGLCVSATRFISALRLSRSAAPVTNPRALSILRDLWGSRRSEPQLLEAPLLGSPLLLGWGRSAIVVQQGFSETHSEEEIRMVLAHEIAHIRRGDQWLALGPLVVQLAFWFHPLAWLASREINLAREEACDLEVVRLSGATPGAYARLLLKLAQSSAPVAAMGVALGYRTLRRRIMTLKHVKLLDKPRRGIVWLCLIALAAVPWMVTAKPAPQTQHKPKTEARQTLPSAHKPKSQNVTHAKQQDRAVAKKAAPLSAPPVQTRRVTKAAIASVPTSAPSVAAIAPVPGTPQKAADHAVAAGGSAVSVTTPARAEAARNPDKRPIAPGASIAPSSAIAKSQPVAAGGAATSTSPSVAGSGSQAGSTAAIAPTSGTAGTGAGRPGSEPPMRSADVVSDKPGDMERLITLQFDEIDADRAVRAILRAAGMNYAFKTDLSSTKLTCSLTNVTAEAALQTVLKLIDRPVTYRIEGGTVIIVNR